MKVLSSIAILLAFGAMNLNAQDDLLDELDFDVVDESLNAINVEDYLRNVYDDFEVLADQFVEDSLLLAEAYNTSRRDLVQSMVEAPSFECMSKTQVNNLKSLTFTKIRVEAQSPYIKGLNELAVNRRTAQKEILDEAATEAKEIIEEEEKIAEKSKDENENSRIALVKSLVNAQISHVGDSIETQYKTTKSSIYQLNKTENNKNLDLKSKLIAIEATDLGTEVCFKVGKKTAAVETEDEVSQN